MKRILFIGINICLMIMLISCEVSYAPSIEPRGQTVYTTYELGVNFTDHMLAIASENTEYLEYLEGKMSVKPYRQLNQWYEVMFTHQLDYLYPQIFYYIPMNHNFDTTEKWSIYFKNWAAALETRNYDLIAAYLEETTIEAYVQKIFNETPEELWSLYYLESLDLIDDMEKLYLKAFVDYRKEVWPDLSFELNKRCNYVNELLNSQKLVEKWEQYTHLTFEQEVFRFSLSKIKHRDFDYTSINSDKIVLYYNLKEEPFEYAEILSHHMGYILLTHDNGKIFQTYVTDYQPMSVDFNLYKMINDAVRFTVSQYNGYVMRYETERYLEFLKEIDEFKYLRFNIPPADTGIDRMVYALNFYFGYVAYNIPYAYDDGIHYNSVVYDEWVINETLSIHTESTFPTIIEKDGEFKFITQDAESIPAMNGTKMLVISPYRFELIGNLYLYDYETEELEQLTELPFIEQTTIKKVIWFDDETLYYIKGFAYGTVSKGGQLYKMDIETKHSELVEVVPMNSFVEISDIAVNDGKLFVTVVTHDERYYDYTEEVIELEMED